MNTTPSWGFPSARPGGRHGLTPGGAPNRKCLASQVGGIGALLLLEQPIYGEVAVYHTARQGPAQLLGAGLVTNPVIQDVAPYWRVFLQQQWGKHSVQVGHFGLVNRNISGSSKPPALDANGNQIPVNPNLLDTQGPIDRFTDMGFDAQYQFIGKKHIFTVQTSYIHEDQRLNNTDSQGWLRLVIPHTWTNLKSMPITTIAPTTGAAFGGTIAYVNLWGSRIGVLIPPALPSFRALRPWGWNRLPDGQTQ